MSDPRPQAPDAESDEVSIHRRPRYSRFLFAGAALGAIAALALTYGFPENDEFGQLQVLGFLLLICVTVGLALGGLLASILDRVGGRRSRSGVVQRETLIVPREEREDADEVDPPVAPRTGEGAADLPSPEGPAPRDQDS